MLTPVSFHILKSMVSRNIRPQVEAFSDLARRKELLLLQQLPLGVFAGDDGVWPKIPGFPKVRSSVVHLFNTQLY